MAFPRTFKSQTWFVRLSSGEIESATASALERSFHSGLVDARTQVRAVGTHVWTTLGEAAEIKDGPVGSLTSASSLSPMAIDEMETSPPPCPDGEAPWHVRNFGDATTFRNRTNGRVASTLAIAAAACMVALGMRITDEMDIDFSTRSSSMIAAATAPPAEVAEVAPKVKHTMRESEQFSKRSEERFAKQEIVYLRELDLARRMRGDDRPRAGRVTSRTPVTPPIPVRPSFLKSEPLHSSTPFDPLDERL